VKNVGLGAGTGSEVLKHWVEVDVIIFDKSFFAFTLYSNKNMGLTGIDSL
jgi:hypothetical protein